MGVDNEAILVYGWVFDCEDFRSKIIKILYSVGIDPNYNMDNYELVIMFKQYLSDLHPGFRVGYTNPYYDCDETECEYYLTFEGIEDTEHLYKIMTDVYGDKDTEYEIVKMMDLTDKPELYALPHVT